MFDAEEILKKLILEEKAVLCSGKDFWHIKGIERLNLPSIMITDGPHGLRKQMNLKDHLGVGESLKTVCFPTASALASSFDRNLAAELGGALAGICLIENVSVLLGPGVNIKRSPLCGRNFEYLSEDPYLSGEMAASYISALEVKGICTAVKHFAANNQETARMLVSSDVEERALFEIYFPAFEAAVKKGGVSLVMTSYNKLNGVYASENEWLIDNVLRKKWGFKGVTVTDWGAIIDRVKSLAAGLDIEMPNSGGETDNQIVDAVRNGILSVEVLDKTVLRILNLIKKASSIKDKLKPEYKDYHFLAFKIAAESAVLLKNNGFLPLAKNRNYVCIGDFAANPRFQGGGSSRVNADRIDIPLMELHKFADIRYFQESGSDSVLSEEQINKAAAMAQKSDGAIVFAGLPYEAEGTDRNDIDLPQNQNILIEKVCKAQPNTVVVLMAGSPVSMPWNNLPAAIINFHLGGQAVGSAIAKILFGEISPCGKLAETYPVRIEDTPCYLEFPGNGKNAKYSEGIFVGYRYYDSKKIEPLYPFGHGLSYTGFEYSNLKLNKNHMRENDTLTVNVKIKNTGKVFGKEVVQIYVREVCPKIVRPQKELRGFMKIALNPEEEKEIEFFLNQRDFSYYDEETHDFKVNAGTFEILVGSSSRDIRLRDEVRIDAKVEKRKIDICMAVREILDCGIDSEAMDSILEIIRNFETQFGATLTQKKKVKGGQTFDFLKLIKDMPLRALISFSQGKISLSRVEQLIKAANSKVPEQLENKI